MTGVTCPNCSNTVTELARIDTSMKEKLAVDLGMQNVPEAICQNCLDKFSSQASQQSGKKSRREEQGQRRLNLWRSRVRLIREARDRFATKNYMGSALAYEKYLRVLELVYETKPNDLKVMYFNNPARAKELLVITSAYWDLARIYDRSEKFGQRMEQCAEKLGEFLPFTPSFKDLLNKIDDYRKVAVHKKTFDNVIALAKKKKKRCFIATAAFESPEAPAVKVLCSFRDDVLETRWAGRTLTHIYYRLSPPVAIILDHSPRLRKFTRQALIPIAFHLGKKYSLKISGD